MLTHYITTTRHYVAVKNKKTVIKVERCLRMALKKKAIHRTEPTFPKGQEYSSVVGTY